MSFPSEALSIGVEMRIRRRPSVSWSRLLDRPRTAGRPRLPPVSEIRGTTFPGYICDVRWSPISTQLFDAIVASDSTQVIRDNLWLHWIHERGVVGVYAWRMPDGPKDVDSTGSMLTAVEGVFDVIRESGSTAFAWKASRYVVKTADGQVMMSGPIKDIDYGHHIDTIPSWPIRTSRTTAPPST